MTAGTRGAGPAPFLAQSPRYFIMSPANGARGHEPQSPAGRLAARNSRPVLVQVLAVGHNVCST